MTNKSPSPSKQQLLLEELDSIADRLGKGDITAAEADSLAEEVLLLLQKQTAVDVESKLLSIAKARQLKRLTILAAVVVIITVLFLLMK